MAQGFIPYDGYPQPFGAKIAAAGDLFGSNNYQVGGYNFYPASAGMSRFEHAHSSSLTQSGNYYFRVIYPNISGNNELRAPTFPYVVLKWYYAANNNEVANNTSLAAEVGQFDSIGI
jgi:hypothetical protein